jgi:hypothetical protein
MREYWYKVYFELGNRVEMVHADCKQDAIILAQAEQIKKGNRCDDVMDVERIDDSNGGQ